ncbi:MAG TPA: FtsX-like permease family protein [Pirellulaceae bacterium]|nr:FtsX-like permease family protein [Pirellulaceae bacterium]
MKTQLAWKNLLHNRVKTSVAIAGVVFAIVLMFMQLGFLEAVKVSATLIYDALDFDVCIRSKDYLHLADARLFPRQRLSQATSVRGIASVSPLTVASNAWRNAQTGQRRAILCFGVVPSDPVFVDQQLQTLVRERLTRSDALLIDTKTRREYGPANERKFGPLDYGSAIELSGNNVTIVGDYTRGAGLTSGGASIMSERGLQQITPTLSSNSVSLGLIKLAEGESAREVIARLRQVLPDDVDVLSRQELLRGELNHWVYETNYGLIFQTGVLVALIVGTAIVYQVLASDVASLLPEYATLKAMGYSNRYLAGVILQQALALAIIGFLLGMLVSQLLYEITSAGAQIPVRMTWQNLAVVLVLSVVMCTCSGLAALRKAFQADPAELF